MSNNYNERENLSRWLDDELSDADAEMMEQQLAADRMLREEALELSEANAAFRRQAKAELSAPVSLEAVAVIQRGFAKRKAVRAKRSAIRGWMPVAASLLVLVGAGLWVERTKSRASEDRRIEIAELIESAVQNALETAVSGSEVVVRRGADGPDVLVVPIRTYRSETNHWCREFREQVIANGETITRNGVACREPQGHWYRIESDGA